MPETHPLRPVTRPRLYEQVAQQILGWVRENGLQVGDRLPPERELATRLGVTRATVSQALVAMEVVGVVAVRHGDGAVLVDSSGTSKVVDALRRHARQLPDVIEAREALESKLAGLAATRRTDADLARIDDALAVMAADIEAGGRGVEGDELFHAAVTAAGHSALLERLMGEIADLVRETRIESLSQPERPRESLEGHRRIASAIRDRDAAGRHRGDERPRRAGQRRRAAPGLTAGMDLSFVLAVLAAGFGAGFVLTAVGAGSLVSFPILRRRRAVPAGRQRLQQRRPGARRGHRGVRLPARAGRPPARWWSGSRPRARSARCSARCCCSRSRPERSARSCRGWCWCPRRSSGSARSSPPRCGAGRSGSAWRWPTTGT